MNGEVVTLQLPMWGAVLNWLALSLCAALVAGIALIAVVFKSLFFALFASVFAGIFWIGGRASLRRMVLDAESISESVLWKITSIRWSDASVNAWERVYGVSVSNHSGK